MEEAEVKAAKAVAFAQANGVSLSCKSSPDHLPEVTLVFPDLGKAHRFHQLLAESLAEAKEAAPKTADLAGICHDEVHVYGMYQAKCWCGKETRPPLWADVD